MADFLKGYQVNTPGTRSGINIGVDDLYYQPSPQTFQDQLTHSTTTGTANVFDWTVSAEHGLIQVDSDISIENVHCHVLIDGTGGQHDLEIWRIRSAVSTRIATLTVASGGGNGSVSTFTFGLAANKNLLAGDTLTLQASAIMTGNPIAAVINIHFDPIAIVHTP